MVKLVSEGEYILENICGSGCPCRQQDHFTHLNAVRNPMEKKKKAQDYEKVPNPDRPEAKMINVRGRAEHEAILKDPAICEELGIDRLYESMVYLKRWGGWLGEQ